MDDEVVLAAVRGQLEPIGFEVQPFRVGAYNALVDEKFALPAHDDSLALLVISIPEMFELSFWPWLIRQVSTLIEWALVQTPFSLK